MKNIDWKDFVDDAHIGIDAFLKYKNQTYQCAGFYNRKLYKCYFYVTSWTEGIDNMEITWEVYTDTEEERWQAFLNAKIFDGKTIQEAGDDVEFISWG